MAKAAARRISACPTGASEHERREHLRHERARCHRGEHGGRRGRRGDLQQIERDRDPEEARGQQMRREVPDRDWTGRTAWPGVSAPAAQGLCDPCAKHLPDEPEHDERPEQPQGEH